MNAALKVFVALALLALAQSFAPHPITQTSTQLNLFSGKKPAGKPADKEKKDVFAGRGKRITIRQDEDDAMWIEEPGDKKKGAKKKDGKSK